MLQDFFDVFNDKVRQIKIIKVILNVNSTKYRYIRNPLFISYCTDKWCRNVSVVCVCKPDWGTFGPVYPVSGNAKYLSILTRLP